MNPQPKLKEKVTEDHVIINIEDDDDDDDDHIGVEKDKGKGLSKHEYKEDNDVYYYLIDDDDDFDSDDYADLDDDTNDDDVEVLISPQKKSKPNDEAHLQSPFVSRSWVTEKGESSRSRLNSGSDQEFECEICTESKPGSKSFLVQGCTHVYCNDCIVRYIQSKLQENITNIRCPVSGCSGLLEPEFCRGILPVELFDRWCVALSESVITEAQRFYCPYKDCSALMIDDGEEVVRESQCPNCNRMFCAQCKVAWHDGIGCEEFQRLNADEMDDGGMMLISLAANKKWRRCPNCRIFVEKTVGCSFIRCRCGASFCYGCGSSQRSHACRKCGLNMLNMMMPMGLGRPPVGINIRTEQPNITQIQARALRRARNTYVRARARQQTGNTQVQAQVPREPALRNWVPQWPDGSLVVGPFPQQLNNTRVQAQLPGQPSNGQLLAQFTQPANNAQVQAPIPQQPNTTQFHRQPNNIQERPRVFQPSNSIQPRPPGLPIGNNFPAQHGFHVPPHNTVEQARTQRLADYMQQPERIRQIHRHIRARLLREANNFRAQAPFPSTTQQTSSTSSIP